MKMRILSGLVLLQALRSSSAFCNPSTISKGNCGFQLHSRRNSDDVGVANEVTLIEKVKNGFLSLGAAATIAGTVMSAGGVMLGDPSPAHAVEISSGAFVIETTAKGEAIFNAQLDSRSIVNTLFKNRNALTKSFDSIKTAVGNEFDSAAVKELRDEILQFEGDVTPDFKISPPNNWQQLVRDLQSGKLNFVVNGEIINVSVEPTFSDSEDDLVIRIVGFKGVDLTKSVGNVDLEQNGISRSLGDFWEFWQSPLPEPYSKYLPDGVQLDTGGAILSGTGLAIIASYVVSYQYYLSEIEREEAAAAAKQAALREKKAAAAEKKAAEDKKAADDKKAAEVEQAKTEKDAEDVSEEESSSDESSDEEQKKKRFPWRR